MKVKWRIEPKYNKPLIIEIDEEEMLAVSDNLGDCLDYIDDRIYEEEWGNVAWEVIGDAEKHIERLLDKREDSW